MIFPSSYQQLHLPLPSFMHDFSPSPYQQQFHLSVSRRELFLWEGSLGVSHHCSTTETDAVGGPLAQPLRERDEYSFVTPPGPVGGVKLDYVARPIRWVHDRQGRWAVLGQPHHRDRLYRRSTRTSRPLRLTP